MPLSVQRRQLVQIDLNDLPVWFVTSTRMRRLSDLLMLNLRSSNRLRLLIAHTNKAKGSRRDSRVVMYRRSDAIERVATWSVGMTKLFIRCQTSRSVTSGNLETTRVPEVQIHDLGQRPSSKRRSKRRKGDRVLRFYLTGRRSCILDTYPKT
jgi:hypothetical protein